MMLVDGCKCTIFAIEVLSRICDALCIGIAETRGHQPLNSPLSTATRRRDKARGQLGFSGTPFPSYRGVLVKSPLRRRRLVVPGVSGELRRSGPRHQIYSLAAANLIRHILFTHWPLYVWPMLIGFLENQPRMCVSQSIKFWAMSFCTHFWLQTAPTVIYQDEVPSQRNIHSAPVLF